MPTVASVKLHISSNVPFLLYAAIFKYEYRLLLIEYYVMEYTMVVDIFFGVGVLVLLYFFYLLILSKQTKKWVAVESIIDDSKLEVMNEELGNDSGVLYITTIKYQYMVEGIMYSSKKIFIGDHVRKFFHHSAKALINKYAKGKTVLVYYNPKRPNKSVLETGVHTEIYRVLFVGILFLLLSVVMWIV